MPQEYLSPAEAAEYLGVGESWLERDRFTASQAKSSPAIPFARLGHRTVRYRRVDLDTFVERNLCK